MKYACVVSCVFLFVAFDTAKYKVQDKGWVVHAVRGCRLPLSYYRCNGCERQTNSFENNYL